jgi:hypothetical protein
MTYVQLEHIAVGAVQMIAGMPYYIIGKSGDPIYASSMGGGTNWKFVFTLAGGAISWNISIYETAETVIPLDKKFLPEECMSKVIDLDAFTTTDDTNFNLELYALAVASAQAGWTLQTKTVHDSGNALRTACSTNRQLLIVSNSGSAAMTFPVGAGIEDGKATCVTFVGLTIVGTVNCELKSILQFYSGTDEVALYVKATPLA